MAELIIAPSVLSLDYSNMNEQVEQLQNSKAKWLHFDVMDGHFVPNLTFGPDILKGFKKACDLYLDVHLMVSDPQFFAPVFIKAGADMVTFHTEALDNDPQKIRALLDEIHAQNAKPGTAIEQFEQLLPYADMVLIMSVEPGFGGQSFMEEQLKKVSWLAEKKKEKGLDYRIEIDGGISDKTYKKAVLAGADTLVAGSYVFKNGVGPAIESLLS
jgi:ribulose-phosphate 3-epimerase